MRSTCWPSFWSILMMDNIICLISFIKKLEKLIQILKESRVNIYKTKEWFVKLSLCWLLGVPKVSEFCYNLFISNVELWNFSVWFLVLFPLLWHILKSFCILPNRGTSQKGSHDNFKCKARLSHLMSKVLGLDSNAANSDSKGELSKKNPSLSFVS